jgi:glycosyltransferase involved in cell wall biosynthesis
MTLDAHLTVLVPARNAEHLLPGWLASVSCYADAVIALDDGSTDRTRAILEEHPLVTDVRTNPVRRSYHGWDDLANRQRLVDAALHAGAQWLLFLDADERIASDDARALRHFLADEARPGYAYGCEVFRMVDDEHHYDPRAMWVFRLFSALDAVQPLGSQRLHFVPVPSGIPRQRWLRTSIRIQHAGSLTTSHRRARFEKYREADPGNDFQADYTALLSDPAVVEAWPARPRNLAVLLGGEGRYVDRLSELDDVAAAPAITAVVIAQNDVAVIDRAIGALINQEVDEEFEIILVCSGADGTVEHVRNNYPTVRCVQLPAPALPGEARNAGLWMARGEYVTFPGSHVWLLPGSLGARLHAHDDGWDLVTGSVVNGNTTRAGWASYFLDHSTQTPSRPSGEYWGAPGHVSYVTRDVRAVGGFPEDMRAGEDTVVNHRLFFAGKRTFFCAPAAFAHASPSTSRGQLLSHHFQRGRALGRIIRSRRSGRTDLAWLRTTISLPARRLRTIAGAVRAADDDLRRQYRTVRGLVVAGALSASTGTWTELLSRKQTVQVAHDGPVRRDGAGPILVVGGRPGEAAAGLLAAGTAAQATTRLMTFTRYARCVCGVRPALAPIVTSATVTAEHIGTYTIDLPPSTLDTYLRAVRDVGASLLLQVQPGRAGLAALVERWQEFLAEPDVGIFFDLRPETARADQQCELDDAAALVRRIGGATTMILVRGVSEAPADVIVVDDTLDLRRPGTPFPHDALVREPRPRVLVYQ